MKRKCMSVKEPVDVYRQTLHALIPGLDRKAAIRINKLRRLSIIGFSIVGAVGFGGYGIAYLIGQFNIITAAIVVVITTGVYLTTAAYLMRKWSIEWNQNLNR